MFKAEYWDIESLSNCFTLAHYQEEKNLLTVYILLEEASEIKLDASFCKKVTNYVRIKNPNFKGKTTIEDLCKEEANFKLYKHFFAYLGDKVTDPLDETCPEFQTHLRPTCQTDYTYDIKKHPSLLGYNTREYDMTMLAAYFQEVYKRKPSENQAYQYDLVFRGKTTPALMRKINNNLFSSTYKKKMSSYATKAYNTDLKLWYDNLLLTGRYIDLAMVNETKKYQALKRLFGYLGLQILEYGDFSDERKIETEQELLDLIAYNASDVINLKHLYELPFYQNNIKQKYDLINEYPEIVYKKEDRILINTQPNGKKNYRFKKDPKNVNPRRKYVDDGSPHIADAILCPYGRLKDSKVVSFIYPHPKIAEELGIESKDVLEDTREWFEEKFPDPNSEARKDFKRVYDYYANIRGKNFNNSEYHGEDYDIDVMNPYDPVTNPFGACDPKTINEEESITVYYYDKEGNKTTCTNTISIGGTHGQEMSKLRYDSYIQTDEIHQKRIEVLTSEYKFRRKTNLLTLDPQTKAYIKPSVKLLKTDPKGNFVTLSSPPAVFSKKRGSSSTLELNKQASYTSFAIALNDDFLSYYPNMLRNMYAFYNPDLGYDRYGEVYEKKGNIDIILAKNKKAPKEKQLTKEELNDLNAQRNGTKLLLNSITGLAGAQFYCNTRMNNNILAMRIIGQLFTYRIGQALAYEGARVFSTNTDGLYLEMKDRALHDKILKEESANINIEIEPEEVFIVSKDTNSRFVIEGSKTKASGGDLNAYYGPSPNLLPTTATIVHYTLLEYLKEITTARGENALNEPFDPKLATKIMKDLIETKDSTEVLKHFQILLTASSSSCNYPIMTSSPGNPTDSDSPILLSKISRTFLVKPQTNKQFITNVSYKKISTTTLKKRKSEKPKNETHYQDDEIAKKVLERYGVKERPSIEHEATFLKTNGIEPHWNIHLDNHSLYEKSEEERQELIQNLNLDNYLSIVKDKYEANWRNHPINFPHDLSQATRAYQSVVMV